MCGGGIADRVDLEVSAGGMRSGYGGVTQPPPLTPDGSFCHRSVSHFNEPQ